MSLRTSLLVFSNPVAGRESDYNQWYDDVHLAEVAALPGVASAQRFRQSQVGPQGTFGHLAIYELDGDPADVLAALSAGIADGSIKMSDAIDLSTVSMTVWEPGAEAS